VLGVNKGCKEELYRFKRDAVKIFRKVRIDLGVWWDFLKLVLDYWYVEGFRAELGDLNEKFFKKLVGKLRNFLVREKIGKDINNQIG
jgi:hypothetical protein